MFDESGFVPGEEVMNDGVEDREVLEEVSESEEEVDADVESEADKLAKELLGDRIDSLKLVEQFLPPKIMERIQAEVDKIMESKDTDLVKAEKIGDKVQEGVDELDEVRKKATERLVSERGQIKEMLGNYLVADDAEKAIALEAMGRFALRGIEVTGEMKLDADVEMEGVNVNRKAVFDIKLQGEGGSQIYEVTDSDTGLTARFPKTEK